MKKLLILLTFLFIGNQMWAQSTVPILEFKPKPVKKEVKTKLKTNSVAPATTPSKLKSEVLLIEPKKKTVKRKALKMQKPLNRPTYN